MLPAVLEAAERRRSPLESEVTGLFEQLRQPLFRYLLSIGLAVQDCEEVIQEIFLALFRHLQKGKSRENLRGWVFRVGHNLGLRRRRQNGRDSCGHESAFEIADASPNPEAQAMDGQK